MTLQDRGTGEFHASKTLFYCIDTLLLKLSSKRAAINPIPIHNTFVTPPLTEVTKLSNGTIIIVAAMTIPTIA